MYSFRNDYAEGAHPCILALMQETNLQQSVGYGEDELCARAKELISRELARQDAHIHFLSGGTQTNMLAIGAALRPHEAVLAAETGHVCVHEAGAIEAGGHKILSVPTHEGKLHPALLKPLLDVHNNYHMVKPRLVYISNSTELGTVYNRQELQELHAFCREHNLLLYVDGARLGAALVADGNELTLADLAAHTDAFSIGGTKNGAWLGEALVLLNRDMQADFAYLLKQNGALLAKGRLLGLQFIALFEDGLYYQNARHANAMAMRIKQGLQQRGYRLLSDSSTNQLFVNMPRPLAERLIKVYGCELWQEGPEQICIRIVTSWATPEKAVTDFLADLP